MQKRVIRKLRSEFPTEWRGDFSGQTKPSTDIAANQNDWKKLWAKAHGRRYPVPPAPKLPKGKMAVGIFLGESESRADIAVTGSAEDKKRLSIIWQAAAQPAITSGKYEQYLLKFVDKTDKKTTLVRTETSPAPAPALAAPKI
jgi:hypothetical protein